MQWANKTVLITGAPGFLGSHLSPALVALGARVHGASRHPPSVGDSHVRWWQADLQDFQQTQHLITQVRPDYIFHLASIPRGGTDLDLILPTFTSEVMGTVHLLTACTSIDVRRIILAGSLEEPEGGDPPHTPYSAAKAAARGYARLFSKLYHVPLVMTRIFMTYGPNQPNWKLIPHSIEALLSGKPLDINSGTRLVDWIFVSDIIAGLIAVAEVEGLEGESVDLGSGELVTVENLVEQLRHMTGSRSNVHYRANSGRRVERVTRADLASTTARIGWQPLVSLEEGLGRTIAHLRANCARVEDPRPEVNLNPL